jgi:hypothetical protein
VGGGRTRGYRDGLHGQIFGGLGRIVVRDRVGTGGDEFLATPQEHTIEDGSLGSARRKHLGGIGD